MLNSIVQACMKKGYYTLSSDTLEPAIVLQRLLHVLLMLDPDAHRSLTADGSTYSFIPRAALHDAEDQWWGSEGALELIEEVITAIDVRVVPHGFICSFEGADHFLLERFDAGVPSAPMSAHATDSPPSISALRARVRPGRS